MSESDMDKRYALSRQIWASDYARILTHARATKELSKYENLKSAVTVNYGVTGSVPVVAGAAFAHIFKTKPDNYSKHSKAVAGIVGLAILTNMFAAYSKS